MGAIIDPSGRYRFLLTRPVGSGEGSVLFIMLNPSTADAEKDDPTIRKLRTYAELWDYAPSLVVVNLFAYRATDPKVLKTLGDVDIVGSLGEWDNDTFILRAACDAAIIVCAWGNHGSLLGRDQKVLNLLRDAGYGPKLHVLKINKATGMPAHPLYLKNLIWPKPWADQASTSAISGS